MGSTDHNTTTEAPPELSISTSVEHSVAIIREMNKIVFWEKVRKLMPAITKVLADAGVDFSKATIPSEEEVEVAIQRAMKEGYLA